MARFEFRLPDPGEGLTEAEIVEWYVEAGDEVQEDEPLCDVETDKAVVEIPIPCTGTVEELRAEPGDVVAVGDVIAVFETDRPPAKQQQETMGSAADESAQPPDADTTTAETDTASEPPEEVAADATAQPGTEAEAVTSEPPTETDAGEDRIFAAPSTRRYAREQGIDLAEVDGTGPNGRILQEDVDRHLEAQQSVVPAETAMETREVGSRAGEEGEVVRRPLQGIRRRIAENMVRSKQTIPHVTSGFEADAEALVSLKERLDAKHDDVRITYTPILVKAIVPALEEYPLVNASIDDDAEEIVEKRYYNIGVATHTEEGLMVPVIKNADEKSLVEVAAELTDLVEAARDRTIDLAALQDGTFTITNVGSHGGHGTFGTPIINHPEAAILGVGRITDEPTAVSEDEVEVRKQIGLTLSYDHRLIDGVTAGGFMETVIEAIEDPDMLLSRL